MCLSPVHNAGSKRTHAPIQWSQPGSASSDVRRTPIWLAGLPGRQTFRQLQASTYDYERLSIPHKAGGRYFFTRKAGARDHPVLVMRERSRAERILLDPASWSRDGTVTFSERRASRYGSRGLCRAGRW
ncbi:hypothetical protein [Sphingobium sp.]|uniref:hypothetical protein n=1 Tax=Sphingobium sp. TaxID=1912891 RepID=UPI0039C9E966